MSHSWISKLLEFWFKELEPKQWFEKSAALDETVRERFGVTYAAVAQTFQLDSALTAPEPALAHIILFDQLPRNMFRDTPRAFESDTKALSIAKTALARGFDRNFDIQQRVFLYLPFEHSEVLADQIRSVELFSALGDANYLRYAEAHRAIIERFGRFPHRNAILSRPSTVEETEFLDGPDSSF